MSETHKSVEPSPLLRNVLITGASTGLGLAIAQRLLPRNDLRLILTARSSSLERFREAGLEESDRLHIRPLRVNTDCERRAVVSEIDERWGGVDILINNAGVAYRAVMEHLKCEEIDRQMEINFSAPLQLIRLALPNMRRKRGGRIINVSSVGGIMAMPTMTPYSASKWALEGVSEALWYEMRPWNIHVSVVQPGFIHSNSFQNTRMTEASQESFDNSSDPYHPHYFYMERFIRKAMNRTWATPESIAKKIEKVMDAKHPPLRVPATPDAHIFGLLRRLVPSLLFHEFLYRALPSISKWGFRRERYIREEVAEQELKNVGVR
ncbi:MAG: SDR family NAD(P)-dependent oxidoreductase [Verrucomicrobiota bacterium]